MRQNMNNYKFVNQLAAMICASVIFLSGASYAGHHEESDKGHQSAGTIAEIAVAAKGLTTLVAALKAADLVETLASGGPFTVLAPTDEAFGKLPGGTIEKLLANPDQLKGVLLSHVIDGKVPASTVVTLNSATALNGKVLSISTEQGVSIGGANVVKTDIAASNGIIHLIDTVITQ